MDEVEEARAALEAAIVAYDRACSCHERGDDEILVDWLVVIQHDRVEGDDVTAQMATFTSRGWPRHKVLGFLREAQLYAEAELFADVLDDRRG